MRKRRLEQNLTQSDLAEKTGLSLKYIGQLERGDGRGLRLQTIERICAVIGWNPFAQLREPSPQLRAHAEATIRYILGALEPWLVKLDALAGTASQLTTVSAPPLTREPRSSAMRPRNKSSR